MKIYLEKNVDGKNKFKVVNTSFTPLAFAFGGIMAVKDRSLPLIAMYLCFSFAIPMFGLFTESPNFSDLVYLFFYYGSQALIHFFGGILLSVVWLIGSGKVTEVLTGTFPSLFPVVIYVVIAAFYGKIYGIMCAKSMLSRGWVLVESADVIEARKRLGV